MNAMIASLTVFSLAPAYDLPTTAWQMVPHVDGELRMPKVTKTKAVLCIPGLYPHPIRPEKALKPETHPWFEPKAPLLKALAADFDVYAIGYAQTVPLDAVALSHGMRETVERLRQAGYTEIVLIGHSAGGLIAHQFAEHYPKSGVTKVIPVSAPYGGSEIADLNFGIGMPKTQVAYIKSLSPQRRLEALELERPLPKSVEICCVVCKINRLPNDMMVNVNSQWPAQLRKQGVPATLVSVNHFEALEAPQGVTVVADLARGKLTRWSPEETAKASAIIFSRQADGVAAANPSRKEHPFLHKMGDMIEDHFAKP